jgi:hypothetical protein
VCGRRIQGLPCRLERTLEHGLLVRPRRGAGGAPDCGGATGEREGAFVLLLALRQIGESFGHPRNASLVPKGDGCGQRALE